MENEFTFDDFKEAEETPQYINDSISNVFEKERTAVEQFKQRLDDQLQLSDYPKTQLTEVAIGYIQGAGDINQVNTCEYYSKNGVALDAWGFSGV